MKNLEFKVNLPAGRELYGEIVATFNYGNLNYGILYHELKNVLYISCRIPYNRNNKSELTCLEEGDRYAFGDGGTEFDLIFIKSDSLGSKGCTLTFGVEIQEVLISDN